MMEPGQKYSIIFKKEKRWKLVPIKNKMVFICDFKSVAWIDPLVKFFM